MTTSNHVPYKYLQFKGGQSYRRYIQQDISKDAPSTTDKGKDRPDLASHGSYGALLFHPNWKAKRREILERDKHRCVHCYSSEALQVHHRQYHFLASEQKFRLPWEYPDRLLITLCESCHNKGHRKFKVPTITL
ncbi:hypothetical protein [uncultured Chitinophaga sp.]|jgi:hypothetical protein|uniref:HNH endonuclease n=1 Tax=uncultured Chitinophaga sp. TaxID=339340 RepID=UPI0026382A9F|nr:hypothetical protein [uncultured Chitinophaga sp.]